MIFEYLVHVGKRVETSLMLDYDLCVCFVLAWNEELASRLWNDPLHVWTPSNALQHLGYTSKRSREKFLLDADL